MDYPDNVKFVAAKNFETENGLQVAGEVVKGAKDFFNLEALVRGGFLYPYAPEDGYSYLPPHLFNELRTRKEVLAKIEGDPTAQTSVNEYEKPEAVKVAEKQAEAQQQMYDLIRDQGDKNLRKSLAKQAKKNEQPLEESVQPKPKADLEPEKKKVEPKKADTPKPGPKHASQKTAAKK